ncbi:hypothetical protein GS921_00365 [Rhodococcus hoagii]|nr:hypothetical protein [Prescottella equi]NKV28232.1 hypothetical protein [Prescottella equi]
MSTAERINPVQILALHQLDIIDGSCTGCDWNYEDADDGHGFDLDLAELHAAHVVAALTNAGKTIVDDAREEWSHRNRNGGASFHPTRESAEAEQAAWERERREGGGYRRLGPSMPPSDGIYRRTVTGWEPAAARVAEGGERRG